MTQTTESELATIMLAIGRLEGKVDSLLARQDDLQMALHRVEKRVHELEGMKHKMLGAAAIVGALVSIGARFIRFGA